MFFLVRKITLSSDDKYYARNIIYYEIVYIFLSLVKRRASDYLDCKYKDELTSDILFEGGVILSDNQTETDFRMEMENESFEAMYDGHFALKDGTIEITFKEGALTTKSTEGDSDSHQVAALEDSAKTIVLTK